MKFLIAIRNDTIFGLANGYKLACEWLPTIVVALIVWRLIGG